MKKILILGLEEIHNYGENFLLDCLQYSVQLHGGVSTVTGNLEPAMGLGEKLPYYALMSASRMLRRAGDRNGAARLEYRAVKGRCAGLYARLMEDADGLIFGAGSYKYGTQKLWAYYSLAVEMAGARGIPVMFNAMNIQQYDGSDWKCRFLADRSARPNVRVITTRDGEEGVRRLRSDYGIPPETLCAPVGDMAYWIPACYGIRRSGRQDTVGVNIISGKIFTRYGGSLSESEAMRFYVRILRGLDRARIPWKLYTNGMQEDYAFGKKVLKLYGAGGENKEVIRPGTPEDLLRLIASCRMILGARLHSCIAAYSMDVPLVGFYWDEKMRHFADLAGIGDLFFEEEDLKGKRLGRRLLEVYRTGYAYDTAKREYWKEQTVRYIGEFLDGLPDSTFCAGSPEN